MRTHRPYRNNTFLILGLLLGSMQAASFAQAAKPAAGNDAKEESLRQTAARTLNSLGVAYFEKQQFAKGHRRV